MKNGNKYTILFSKTAEKDLLKLKNAKLSKVAQQLIDLMCIDPFIYPPKYEKLVGDYTGFYSRRINRQHRIIYKVNDNKKEVYIIRMWTHYEK